MNKKNKRKKERKKRPFHKTTNDLSILPPPTGHMLWELGHAALRSRTAFQGPPSLTSPWLRMPGQCPASQHQRRPRHQVAAAQICHRQKSYTHTDRPCRHQLHPPPLALSGGLACTSGREVSLINRVHGSETPGREQSKERCLSPRHPIAGHSRRAASLHRRSPCSRPQTQCAWSLASQSGSSSSVPSAFRAGAIEELTWGRAASLLVFLCLPTSVGTNLNSSFIKLVSNYTNSTMSSVSGCS